MNATAERSAPSADPRPTQRRRRAVPAGVYMEPGVAGRVLVFLWSMAPWSQGPVAFVWPKLSTIAQALDLWPSQVDKAIRYLKEIRWIRRETRKVRFEGAMVDRLGFVLFDEPSAGPLFEWLRREDEAGEVVVPSPPKVGSPNPRGVGTPSLEEQGSNKKSSSARAQEREPGEDDEESATPIPPRNPPPRPTPPPDEPRPAAQGESVERDLWDTAEQEAYAKGGGWRPRQPVPEQLQRCRSLLNRIRATEGLDEGGARTQVEVAIRSRVGYAVHVRKTDRARGNRLLGAFRADPFSPIAYDRVMAYATASAPVDAKAAWRAREYTPEPDPYAAERRPVYSPDPEPAPAREISNEDMQRTIDETLAEIRAAEGRS